MLIDSLAQAHVRPAMHGKRVGDRSRRRVRSGVDVVHVYAYPASGAPIFIGSAQVGISRPDIAAFAGARFGASGFSIQARGLASGPYQFVAYARSTLTGTFNNAASVSVTVAASTFMAVDIPADGAIVAPTFRVAGWAVDRAAASGPGIDAVHVWAYPVSGAAPFFLGAAALGGSRPDVGAILGSQFTPSGYELQAHDVPFGSYVIVVYGHSSVTGTFSVAKTTAVTVQQTVLLAIDTPAQNATIRRGNNGIFFVFGWAIDVPGTSVPFEPRRDLAFIGGYQHPPNVDAALYFATEIFPLIRRRLPDVRFHVVGSNPTAELRALQSDSLNVVGFVSDLGAFLDGLR